MKGEAALRRRLEQSGELPDYSSWGFQEPARPAPELSGRHKAKTRASKPAGPCANAPVQLLPGTVSDWRPQFHLLKVLHRHEDGYISFSLGDEDGVRPAFAIRASALNEMLPGFVDQLTKDAYVSVNAGFSLARGNRSDPYGLPRHTSSNLRYLCAAYCDVDIYRYGISFDEAEFHVRQMCRSGELPWYSMVVDSGRGMWLMWLLHGHENPKQAHLGAWNKSQFDPLAIYSQINKALCSRLAVLGSDRNCIDGARAARYPGSLNTKSDRKVQWFITGTSDKPFSYTLWELADLLGVKFRRRLPEEVEACTPRRRVPRRQNGQRVANQNRLAAMSCLIGVRAGGFQEGHRNIAAYIFATCLRYCQVEKDEARRRVRELGEDCRPPLGIVACDRAVESGYKKAQKRWVMTEIASRLDITVSEAELISQQIGRVFWAAGQPLVALTRMNGKPKRSDEAVLRQEAIRLLVGASGETVPSARIMEAKLRLAGHECSYVTVLKDYAVLGLKSPQTVRRECRLVGDTAQTVLYGDASLEEAEVPARVNV